jgi:hypothetical protein
MKTIVMICRSKNETPDSFVQLVKAIFPECEVQTVYSQLPLSVPISLKMGGAISAICASTRKTGTREKSRSAQPETRGKIEDACARPFTRSMAGR